MYNILNYGAIPDGKTLNTSFIQNAIDDCHQKGGGKVVVPAGVFYTGSIFLKSNVELHLSHSAVLKASENLDDYNDLDAYSQNYGCPSEEWVGKHVIMAIECTNVALTGTGVIDGNAQSFYDAPKPYMHYVWTDGLALSKDKEKLRPGQVVCFIECTHVTVQDITIQNVTCWGCFLHGCEYATIRGLKVFNPPYAANTDGIDIDCCRFVTISDCIIETGDDAIAIRCVEKRIKNPKPCEYISVSNCVLSSASSTVRIGVGTGTIRHVRFSNLTISRGATAFNFMTSFGGSGEAKIEDVNFSNISATNIGNPFCAYAQRGYIKNITMENIRFESVAASFVYGFENIGVRDITLKDVEMFLKKEDRTLTKEILDERGINIFQFDGTKGIKLDNVRLLCENSQTWDNTVYHSNCTECNFEGLKRFDI